jgi:hypothetical protein
VADGVILGKFFAPVKLDVAIFLRYHYEMNETIFSKKEALALFGHERGAAGRLADALGIARQTVEAWPEGPIRRRYALALLGYLQERNGVRLCYDCRANKFGGCRQGRAVWPHGGPGICQPRRNSPGYQPWEF